jgi:predicted RNase H-like HicB family nuclease
MLNNKSVFNVSLPVTFLREGKYYVAYSPAIDMSTSAETFEKVKSRFDEVVQIFFEELLEKGTLEAVLSSLGWQREQKTWLPPQVIAHESQNFRYNFAS